MIPIKKLKENFKFSVRVNCSHVYFQTQKDKEMSVLKDPNNLPQHWLKTPSSEDVEVLKGKIDKYKKPAKSARQLLLSNWIADVVKEGLQPVDPVTKLSSVRTLGKENIWPCPECTEFGEKLFYC